METPFHNGKNGGRDTAGRFAPGNPGGPGRPGNTKVAELRTALLSEVTAEDVAAVVRALVDKAKSGDVAAARLLLPYIVGPPPDLDAELEGRLEQLEALLTPGEAAA